MDRVGVRSFFNRAPLCFGLSVKPTFQIAHDVRPDFILLMQAFRCNRPMTRTYF